MKEFILVVCLLAVGGFCWFACQRMDFFMDKLRKGRKKHREDNLPGKDE